MHKNYMRTFSSEVITNIRYFLYTKIWVALRITFGALSGQAIKRRSFKLPLFVKVQRLRLENIFNLELPVPNVGSR